MPMTKKPELKLSIMWSGTRKLDATGEDQKKVTVPTMV